MVGRARGIVAAGNAQAAGVHPEIARDDVAGAIGAAGRVRAGGENR